MLAAAGDVIPVMLDFSDRRNPPADVRELAGTLGIQYLPTSTLAAPNGTPVFQQVGAMEAPDLVGRLEWVCGLFASDFDAALAKARETAQDGESPRRIAILGSDGSDFANELTLTLFSESLREQSGNYVWVFETGAATPTITIYEPNETRTVVSTHEFHSVEQQVRDALGG